MGKKREPLRKAAKSEVGQVKGDGQQDLGRKEKRKNKSPSGPDDDEAWAKIEAADTAAGVGAESNSGSSGDEESEDGGGEIRLQGAVEHISEEFTFEFNDMRDEFANGICTLLRSLVMNPTHAYTLASAISAQTIVGTAIVCEGEHDVFAFATVLPIARQKSGPLFQILQHLRLGLVALNSPERRCSPGIELMTECVAGAQGGVTGIFLHQRFSNLPLELIAHLHRNLDEDLGWAQQLHDSDSDGNAAQEISEFKSLQFVILIACCEMQQGTTKIDLGPANTVSDVSGSPSLLFHNFEDESYFQEAICTVLFKPAQSEHTLCASLIPVASLRRCVQQISSLVSGSGPVGSGAGKK